MKPINRKLSSLFLISFLLISCTTNKVQPKLSYVITGGNSQLIGFNAATDMSIGQDDFRIKSIVLASQQNNTATIHIAYSSFAGEELANKLAILLTKYNVQVLVPESVGIKVNNSFETDKVLVYIHFNSLLKNK